MRCSHKLEAIAARFIARRLGIGRQQGLAPAPDFNSYFGDSVTGTSVMLSTGNLLSSAALRTASSLGAS
jgi:hypothetical protein